MIIRIKVFWALYLAPLTHENQQIRMSRKRLCLGLLLQFMKSVESLGAPKPPTLVCPKCICKTQGAMAGCNFRLLSSRDIRECRTCPCVLQPSELLITCLDPKTLEVLSYLVGSWATLNPNP